MSVYYQDDSVTLYHGDSADILPTLTETANVLLTDPPYFKVKDDEWDNQWDKASEFLGWMGDILDLTKPLLAPHSSLWVFASPAMTSSVERLIGDRFRVLNSIRWVKEAGWHQKVQLSAMRSYLTPWEGIVFAEQYADAYPEVARAIGKPLFAPMGRYIQSERESAGWTRSDLEVALGYTSTSDPTRGTALCYRWEEGSSLPSAATYEQMRSVLNSGGGDYLTREYDDLRDEHESPRRTFSITERARSTDVWNFPPVATYPGKHPCEKPAKMLHHMIETSSRQGELILDPFAGSGSTLLAARDLGRRSIGIERDERYCERIARRLSEQPLDIFGVVA